MFDEYLFNVHPPAFPAQNAVKYLDTDWLHPDRYTLIWHRGSYYTWVGSHWAEYSECTLEAKLYKRFKDAVYEHVKRDKNGDVSSREYPLFGINPEKTRALVQGLRNHILIDDHVNTPTWLDEDDAITIDDLPAKEMISCANVLVHSHSRDTMEHTPRFFNHVSTTYPYQPHAPLPERWLKFLADTFPGDQQAIDTLQEIFGYLLTSRTDLQKMFLIIGPPGSGKGTIIRTMTALLGGNEAVSSISLADLNERFGLGEIATKQVAVMQDARFRSRDDGRAVERILSITGEDPVSVELKGRDLYSGRLPTRFVLVSNEIPKLQDESGALRRRLLLLRIHRVVAESEKDLTLGEKLQEELPGILNWALDGLDRLNARGNKGFDQPDSGADDVDFMTKLASPTIGFVEDCCITGEDQQVSKRDLFRVFIEWCRDTKSFQVSDNVFARNLYSAAPGVRPKRTAVVDPETGTRLQVYLGIGLSPAGEKLLEHSRAMDWAGGLGSGSSNQPNPGDDDLPSI